MSNINTMLGAASQSTVAPPETSQVQSLIHELSGLQGDIHGLISELSGRLDWVMVSYGTEGQAKEQTTPQPLRSSICDQLVNRLESEKINAARLRALISALTV
jgi:hypothetical protein